MYWMYRQDGAGDEGGMSQALWLDSDGKVVVEHDARPRVGVKMRVGSTYARTMQAQDWWLTSQVTRIVSDTEDAVTFETQSGSTYEWCVKR